MRFMKIISTILLFIFISFGTIGGCGGGGNGDNNGNDNGNGDGLAQLCEDFLNALCERRVECNSATNFDDCIAFFELFGGCNTIEGLPDINQCISDLDNFDCALAEETLLPDTCIPVGACDICETDEDCPEELFCSPCFEGINFLQGLDGPPECTGEVDRCAPFTVFFVDCGDGFF